MADPPPLPPLPPAIGLDLGSSYSRAAVLQGGTVKTIKDERGNTSFPTYVGFSSDPDSAVVLVGREARDLSAHHPTNTAVGFKRLLGRTISDQRVVKDEKYLPVELAPLDEKTRQAAVRVICRGVPTSYSPEQLLTMLTAKIVESAFTSMGTPVRDAVVTVPSCFNLYQRQMVHHLCEEAGLNVLCTVNEATAAGLAYCFDKQFPKKRNIVVVNLGAGYLSVVVMTASGSSYDVTSIAGSCDVSGAEIDHILVDYYLQELKKKVGSDIPRNKTFVRTLRLAAAAAKRKLSTAKQATITFQLYNCEIAISRAKLEELCTGIFMKLIDVIESALRNCNSGRLRMNQIDDVVLVGDGSSIPKVQELIKHFFGGKDLTLLSSESAAHGSALLAAVLQNRTYQLPSISSMILTSVLPTSIGIEAPAGLVVTVVPKSSKLPAKETVKVTTVLDRQQKVVVNLYEGESPVTKDNLYLGQVALTIPPAPKGIPKINVTIEVQWDGSVVATVMEETSRSKAEVAVTLDTMRSTPSSDASTSVVACEETIHKPHLESVKQGDDVYYYIPPDSISLTPPLVPKRASKSYENYQLKEAASTEEKARPPPPPRKGYENVELTNRGARGIVTPPSSLTPPVPIKRTRVPRTPPRESPPLTPPLSSRGRDKTTPERSQLAKSKSVPYPTALSPNSTSSLTACLPIKRKDEEDSASSDQPSPYYSLPPRFSPVSDLDIEFDNSSEDELTKLVEEHETYLVLDEDVATVKHQEVVAQDLQLPVMSLPPIPPRERATTPTSSLTNGSLSGHIDSTEMDNMLKKKEELVQHLKERLMETELRMKVFEKQVAEKDTEIKTLGNLLKDAEERLNEEKTRMEDIERERAQLEERVAEAERRASEAERSASEATSESQILQRSDSSSSNKDLHQIDEHQFWVIKEDEIKFTDEEIGRGGWGVVMVAEFRSLRCAAKRMHKLIISNYNRHLFVREMNIAARIRHPNLVQFIGATVENEPIILTELMSCNLRSILEKKPLNPAQILSISLDVARAINYLHLMRPDPVIHRDISSANVLLDPTVNNQWIAKLSDYGSANFVRCTVTAGPGNPTYAAPEANDPIKQGPKMDVYSYGVLLLEMCTRKFPDPRLFENEELLKKIQSRTKLAPVIRQCLKVVPDERPSASDIIVQLQSES